MAIIVGVIVAFAIVAMKFPWLVELLNAVAIGILVAVAAVVVIVIAIAVWLRRRR